MGSILIIVQEPERPQLWAEMNRSLVEGAGTEGGLQKEQ